MSKTSLSKKFDKEHIYIVEVDVPRCINVAGVSPCTASETGDAKCYNTRATCNDLANYNDLISITTSISVSAILRRFQRSSGSFLTDGFEVGQIITTSGFTNPGNNSQFEIRTVTATIITVTTNDGLVTEAAATRTISTPNLFTYRFCSARSPHPSGMSGTAPCIDSVSVAPARVDPSGGIGARTSVSVSMADFPGSDLGGIDPYITERTFDPYDVGMFFTKWRTRNANYENYAARVLSGYIVDNSYVPVNFETRYYVLSTMTATGGKASFKFKDPLQLVSNKKALAPPPSSGTLSSGITAVATSATLEPSGVGAEYPASGFVKIRDEVSAYTRSGDVFTLTRGQFNTVAVAHDSGDTVQWCLHYDGTRTVDLVQADLNITYATIPPIYIPKGTWAAEASEFLIGNPNRLITDPTPVDQLIGELCNQWPHKLFWNDRARQVDFVALKAPPNGEVNQLSFEDNLLELSVSDKPEMQVSTVFVMYGQFDPTKKVDEKDNYQISYARPNLDAIARYDSNNSMTIYAPWVGLGNGAAARRIATLKGRRFGTTPRQASFALEDKDSEVWLGDVRNLLHPDIADQNGRPVATTFEIIQAAEGDTFAYQALEYTYDGELDGDDEIGVGVVDLPIDERNINLRTKYEAIYGTPIASTIAKFIVYSGVVIGSNSASIASIVTGSWPAGATIILQINTGGAVVGLGGNGSSSASIAGGNAGDAISLSYDLELINNGVLGGGGGGGGAATQNSYTAAGGGGAGDQFGIGGVNDLTGIGTLNSATNAEDGSTLAGGAGANIRYTNGGELFMFNGGSGGDLGENGDSGSGILELSLGGTAGKAVDLNGNTLTQTVSGDIFGAIS